MYIGIDLGTSFVKAAVLDLDALRLRHVCRIPFPPPLPGLPADHHEVDPESVVGVTREIIESLLPLAPRCAGVVVCSQMHGLVLTDADARPRSNYVSWLDQRALEPHPAGGTYLDRLAERIDARERRQLGAELQAGLPLGTLFWFAERGQLPDGEVVPASLPDFVLARLCGVPPGTEATNAAAHGTLNLETGDWHHAVLARLGLDRLSWPPIRRWGEVVGTARLGGARLACHTPLGDHQCALVGAGLEADELSINVSTGSQVSCFSPRLALGDYQTRPYVDGTFLDTITRIPAGRALNVLVGLVGELGAADPWPSIAEAAAAVAATDLRVDLAFFPGPFGDRGAIANIREGNLTVGHLFRAAFQQMAENYHAGARRLVPDLPWRSLVFSGGLARKLPVLREIIERRFGLPARLSSSSEDTLLGLLALALVASGRAPSASRAIAEIRARFVDEA